MRFDDSRSFKIASEEREFLSQLIAESELADVDQAAVARLARGVRRRAAGERLQGAPHTSRYALAVAAAVFVAASLFGLGVAPRGGGAPLAVSLTADGAVRIAYADGRAPRHVTRTLDPTSVRGARLDRARDRAAVVDADSRPQPGTVVFYRVD